MALVTEPRTATDRITSTEGLTLAAALVRLSHAVAHLYEEASEANGLTPQQTRMLCMLFGEPVGMTELSQLLHVERSSLTGLVDRVEQRGLVERVPDDRDRRACRIALTSDGLNVALASHAEVTRKVEQTLGELTATEEQHFLDAIKQLLTNHATTTTS